MAKEKVMLGMSGGVDSSVAAALLLDKGYDVIGATLQIWPDICDDKKDRDGGCCSISAVDDARRIADKLGIPYYVLNFKDIFEKNVIDYFKDEYFKGNTPNPCIACNRYVKFGSMLEKAQNIGIEYIATGHYARIKFDSDTNKHLLYKSVTEKKDQTYALYNLTQYQLSKTLFPVGGYSKERVRAIAKDLGFSVSSKPDSQDICFVDDNDYGRFIRENSTEKIIPGNFIDKHGNILGKHSGIVNYTIGQRKGLGITFGKPMFVISINPETNNIILGESSEVFSNSLIADDLNFISIDNLAGKMRVKAKIRYSAKEADATITLVDKNRVEVIFDEPQRAVTPGQAIVFYDGDIVIGGGTIIRK